MKTVYLDAFSGVSGDMLVGALLDLGADFAALERAAAGLGMSGYRLSMRRKVLSGISALKFEVEVLEPQPERHLSEIKDMIERAGLPAGAVRNAINIFQTLAQAEAKVHNTTPDRIHFHEVGAVDSIIDIVAAALCFEHLNVSDVIVSALPMGTGFVRSQHGVIPVPAPATAELLCGFALKMNDGASEMVTPTGAAVIRALARPAPAMMIFESDRIGYGAGTKEFADRPNVLRALIGREQARFANDELIEISTNIDDLNPQVYAHVTERLFAAGARDVTITPTVMKKGRPGVTLSVLAEAVLREQIAAILFGETSTIGLRFHPVARLMLERRIIEVETRFGMLRVKVSGAGGAAAMTIAPEYDDCRRAALAHDAPLKLVMEEALAAARGKLP